jgi:hypothetical protein
VCLAKPIPAALFYGDETAVGQKVYMEGYGLAGHVELLGNRIHVMGLGGYHVDDRPPGRVGYGLVYISSGYHNMQVSACKYICKYLLAQIYFKYFSQRVLAGIELMEKKEYLVKKLIF